jgi:hypothetical protein
MSQGSNTRMSCKIKQRKENESSEPPTAWDVGFQSLHIIAMPVYKYLRHRVCISICTHIQGRANEKERAHSHELGLWNQTQ